MTTTDDTTRAAPVTGAASGLGEAVAPGLARRGWRVGVAEIDAPGAARVAAACTAAGGAGRAIVVELPAADGPERMVAEAVIRLAADAPGYVTAERLNVSGGLDRD